jgi:A/G-specific adenine glycosylase
MPEMPDLTMITQSFSRILLRWNREKNTRHMPWKGERNPYRIWLSEIILQQTRVEQGWDYYNAFLDVYPDIKSLAGAPDDKVFKLWEGLGYYSRCRNLLTTARYIAHELDGEFPSTYESIRELKGVGPYTAAAIASFAYNLPHAVVDGNVHRLLSRVFGIKVATDTTKGKKLFTELANKLLDKKKPGEYNQAIMDFGAVICKPVPICKQCPFNKTCYAYLNDKVAQLPVKEKKIKIKTRWFYYFVIEHRGKVAIRQRSGRDIWKDLYEFPLLENSNESTISEVIKMANKNDLILKKDIDLVGVSKPYRQQLSHQLIVGVFVLLKLRAKQLTNIKWNWVNAEQVKQYAFPKIINAFLEERGGIGNKRQIKSKSQTPNSKSQFSFNIPSGQSLLGR